MSALRAILFVSSLRVIVADKCEFELLDFVVLGYREGTDVAENFEEIFNFFLGLFNWDVFHVDVVDHLTEMSSVSWLELDGLDSIDGVGIESLSGGNLILEADEAVAS